MIELMLVVAIIGILTAVALPSYKDYVIRGKIPQATSGLAAKRVQMEQFFQDNRTYANGTACTNDTATSQYFTFSCSGVPDSSGFVLQAVGTGSMAGFNYTVDQNNTKTSTITAAGWAASSTSCWITKKGGAC